MQRRVSRDFDIVCCDLMVMDGSDEMDDVKMRRKIKMNFMFGAFAFHQSPAVGERVGVRLLGVRGQRPLEEQLKMIHMLMMRKGKAEMRRESRR